MANDKIIIKGAREHNLKNINLTLPREKLIVMTGLSGSGKSSLAFDTIYAEGQRRYVESLSSYARMFLGGRSYRSNRELGYNDRSRRRDRMLPIVEVEEYGRRGRSRDSMGRFK